MLIPWTIIDPKILDSCSVITEVMLKEDYQNIVNMLIAKITLKISGYFKLHIKMKGRNISHKHFFFRKPVYC